MKIRDATQADPALGCYYIAEVDGNAVGQLMTTFEWSDWRNGLFLWIQSVYVLQAHRGGGVFRALYDHLGDLARTDARMGMHRSNYGVMETVYRGPASHAKSRPC